MMQYSSQMTYFLQRRITKAKIFWGFQRKVPTSHMLGKHTGKQEHLLKQNLLEHTMMLFQLYYCLYKIQSLKNIRQMTLDSQLHPKGWEQNSIR